MSRTVSWLPRLYVIRRSVENSVRPHYDRQAIEKLFELQPRAAQKILEMLPAIEVGTSRLIARETLSNFLNQVHEAKDPALLFEFLRRRKTIISRQKTRTLVETDLPSVNLNSLPGSITLSRGQLNVKFQTIEALAEDLARIARLLTNDTEEFAKTYEPQQITVEDEAAEEMEILFAQLRALEAERAAKQGQN